MIAEDEVETRSKLEMVKLMKEDVSYRPIAIAGFFNEVRMCCSLLYYLPTLGVSYSIPPLKLQKLAIVCKQSQKGSKCEGQ